MKAILLVLISSLAIAQDAVMTECASDVAKFCKDIEPGSRKVWRCLRENRSKLSATCREAQLKVRDTVKQAREACKDDTAKFCKAAGMKPWKIASCLKTHEAELSPDCKAFVAKSPLKGEVAHVDAPQVPKVEAPKVEPPKVEAPRIDVPKAKLPGF